MLDSTIISFIFLQLLHIQKKLYELQGRIKKIEEKIGI
jgi:cell division protein FtsL